MAQVAPVAAAGPGQITVEAIPINYTEKTQTKSGLMQFVVAPPDYFTQPQAAGLDPTGRLRLDNFTSSKLQNCNYYKINQLTNLFEAVTGGLFEFKNMYCISDAMTGTMLFVAAEESDTCARCCCAPNHQMNVGFQQPSTAAESLGQYPIWGAGDKKFPSAFSLQRNGGCCGSPFKCLGTCVCCACCADEINVYAGDAPLTPESGERDAWKLGSAHVPIGGGGFTPTLNIMEEGPAGTEATQIAQITGPTCFGGCSEMCCDVNFPIKSTKTETDMAFISKKAPENLTQGITEMFTDSDNFILGISDPNVTPEQKALMLSSTMLLDYMFFERDNDMVYCDGGDIVITCFYMYCCGMLYPCVIRLGASSA